MEDCDLAYSVVKETNGKIIYSCKTCLKRRTSKRRIMDHITSVHRYDEQMVSNGKYSCYIIQNAENDEEGETTFICRICQKSFTTKQRVHYIHGTSPSSKMYKRYSDDPSFPVPPRTARRRIFSDNNKDESNIEPCALRENETQSVDDNNEDESNIEPYALSEIETHSVDDNNVIYEGYATNSFDGEEIIDGVTFNSNSDCETDISESSIGCLSYNSNLDCETDGEESATASSINSSISCMSSNPNSESENDDSFSTDSSEVLSSENELNATQQPYTKDESLALCISAYAARFNLTGDATKYLNKLLSLRAEPSSSLPKIKNDVCTNFKCFSYCSVCFSVYEGDNYICQTKNCGNYRYKGGLTSQTSTNRQPKTSFLIADVGSQLKQVLEKKGVWESVQDLKKKLETPKPLYATSLMVITIGFFVPKEIFWQTEIISVQSSIQMVYPYILHPM